MASSTQFESTRLFLTDFDGAYAMTNELSPNQVTVDNAYEAAVETLFGRAALMQYRAEDGLMNRGPAEVVTQLAPDIEQAEHSQLTEELVQIKLAHLYKEVGQKLPDGSIWPRLNKGFRPIWEKLAEYDDVNLAVVSSGHRSFIERVHEVHELPNPDLMLTDDDMRPLMVHLPREVCAKPSPLLLQLLHNQWMKNHVSQKWMSETSLAHTKWQLLVAGDDKIKDGQMASNYGVQFVHIDPVKPEFGWRKVGNLLLPEGHEQIAA